MQTTASLKDSWEDEMRRRADNGGDYLAARCAGGRGNTTYTPEAG